MIHKAKFIEYPKHFISDYLTEDPAPIFRHVFSVEPYLQKAVLSVCGLGYGYYYLNGKPVSKDLFIAPVSDYNKTLWYNVYDITNRINQGENLIAIILGNGFYNESLTSAWKHNEASWRGSSKLSLAIELTYPNSVEWVLSDESWRCCEESSPVRFNQLRSGETYDSRIPENWCELNYDDSGWKNARFCEKIPTGTLRECRCQPIREDCEYSMKTCFKNQVGNWVLDFGQNMSGYVRLRINQPSGDIVTIRYSEQIKADGSRELNNMEHAYPGHDFQTDRFICNGKETIWSPRFTYHGFRYIELEGLREPPDVSTARAVFVHQAVEELSDFECSNEIINKLYKIGKTATLSNLFYMPTDCPTREKLGWANDAQASTEQMLQNFDTALLLEKWLQDILDSMREDGEIPGIVPSHGWGFEWGTGPVSSGVLFEIPLQIYRYTGSDSAIRMAYPSFLKHLKHITDQADPKDGLIGYGLCDWAGPFEPLGEAPTPVKLTDTLLAIKFHRMVSLAAQICGDSSTFKRLNTDGKALEDIFKKVYLDTNGRCTVNEQTPVAMIIALGVHEDLKPLREQLYKLIKERDFHHHCGMLGMQYLYPALDICGFQEEAYRIITVKGRPSYTEWLDNDATAMWEMWHTGDSKNHHMHSCVLSWFMKTLVGLNIKESTVGFQKAKIAPRFLPTLNFCRGRYKTASGIYEVSWERQKDETVLLNIIVPKGAQAELVLDGYICESSETDFYAGQYSLMCRKIINNKKG